MEKITTRDLEYAVKAAESIAWLVLDDRLRPIAFEMLLRKLLDNEWTENRL